MPNPLRILTVLVAAVAVIAGMLLVADRSREDADRARRAQVVMEQIHTQSLRFDRTTWRSLATQRGQAPQTAVADGLDTYRTMAGHLSTLKRLSVKRRAIARIEAALGATYAVGIRTITLSQSDPTASRRFAATAFSPTLERLNRVVEVAAADQARAARAAKRRTRLAGLGSLGAGLLLLMLLGVRLHRIQRSSAIAERSRELERRGEDRLRTFVRHSSDVVAVIDAGSRVRWIAESVEGLLGHRAEDLLDTPIVDLVAAQDAHRVGRLLGDADPALAGRITRLSLTVLAADGGHRQVEVIADNRLADPEIEGILLNLRDVTDRIALEDQLRHRALHDDLTGLANRALFEDRLTQALTRVRRHGHRVAVLFIDLDDFKTINDSLGHGAGDDVLRSVSSRIEATLRAPDTAARFGGDEFAVLLEDLVDTAEVIDIAERVRAAIGAPLTVGDRPMRLSASIGIAMPDDTTTATVLLGNADVAMYAAKDRGKGQVASFEPAMRDRTVERLELTSELAFALDRDELFLEYQPVVELQSGGISGFEALIRWQHPERGRLPPDRFIAIAESAGLIVPIGRWVLQTALTQLRQWEGLDASGDALRMSVNVSTRQLADPNFPADVRDILDRTGVEPDRVTLEITENLLLQDSEPVQRQLRALKVLGVRLAVDDFGTGYSALSYLQAFPIDVLKIDRSFVSGIDLDDEKARLVQGIVDMGRTLRLTIVTEGIEQPGEAALLRDFRSDYGQGFHFSRPVGAAAIGRLLVDGLQPGPLPDPETP